MRHWRPALRCLYVIPEIHGNIKSAKIILNRLVPLRFHEGKNDKIVLLGDYIDHGENSAYVIELLIFLKAEYGEHFICLKGNHEQQMLNALSCEDSYRSWMESGGSTTIKSYLDLKELDENPNSWPFSRLFDIIPKAHIEFLQSLPAKFEIDKYVFFHGGIDINNPDNTSDNQFIYDTYSSEFMKNKILNGNNPLSNQDKIYVGAHNHKDIIPFVSPNYYMLGGGAPSELTVFELNTMSCSMVKNGKQRIYKREFKYHK